MISQNRIRLYMARRIYALFKGQPARLLEDSGLIPARLSGFLLLGMVVLTGGNICAQPASFPRPAPSWTLSDFRGREWESSDFYPSSTPSVKATVLVFLGTQCPLAKAYANRLTLMANEPAFKEVRFLGINSNVQDSLREISVFARRHEISFPILKDPDALVAESFQATRTPEAFVIDSKGNIRYQGRIDDQYGIGYAKPAPSISEVRLAIESILNNKPVEINKTEATGCLIGKSRYAESTVNQPKEIKSKVTFCKDIAPILNRHCNSCHCDGQIGPMGLSNFHDAAAWAEMICEVISDGRMPPWHADPRYGAFSNDRTLSAKDKETIHRWLQDGTPKGNEEDLLRSTETFDGSIGGWQLSKAPDLIVHMSETPYTVPASGVIDYQYFVVPTSLTEEKWIQSYEIQPGNRSVVHHILVFAQDAKGRKKLQAERSYLAGYVPGTRVIPFPKGMAKKLEAGSQLVFQIHYTPVGKEQHDLSRIGFVFADPNEITHEVKTFSAVQSNLKIPPNDPEYKVEAILEKSMPECQLLSMSPHMHVRGKSFMYEAIFPDGKSEILLNVPKYDFGWQTAYTLADSLVLPAGTKIRCTATFDNSEGNLNNPDPSKWVSWGDQTTDEMMIGYFDYAVLR